MADTITPRRFLQELPVNTHGTPRASNLPASSSVGLKRHIVEVEDPAAAPVPSRLRESDKTESSCLKLHQTSSAAAATMATREVSIERGDDIMGERTQETSNDTASTMMSSDVEGDTMDTQHKAATEPSQVAETEPLSHAQRLRLRLRVALFKVQTNQTNIPISQLRIPSRQSPGQKSSLGPPDVSKHPSQPTLLPAPVLKPTIHSARTARRSQILSSPPSSSGASPMKNSSPELFIMPALPRQRVPPLQHMSSPPGSEDGGTRGEETDHSHLSSSAVKGYAAQSILGLREERGS